MENSIRLLIVDDHPALRTGLAALLRAEPDFDVVAEAGDGIQAVETALAHKPDVILMDLALPKKNGIEAIREITSQLPETRVVVFSSYSDHEHIYDAMQAGAIGYLLKDSSPQDIRQAIRDAKDGRPTLNPRVEIILLQRIQDQKPAAVDAGSLTEREMEILQLLAQGFTNDKIARTANITEGTVRSHISNILLKLGLQNRAQAVLYAIRNGLVDR